MWIETLKMARTTGSPSILFHQYAGPIDMVHRWSWPIRTKCGVSTSSPPLLSFSLATVTIDADKNPYDSNQAIPTLLLGRFRDVLARTVPGLTFESVDLFSFLAYPLSGGFRPWSLLPAFLTRPLLKLEWMCRRGIGPVAAFRILAVFRRKANRPNG